MQNTSTLNTLQGSVNQRETFGKHSASAAGRGGVALSMHALVPVTSHLLLLATRPHL